MSSTAQATPTARLENRDYTLILDKSGSMDHSDVDGFKSRWDAVHESTMAIARKLDKLDPDGITLYLFSSTFRRYDNVTPDAVDRVFAENEPMGGTALHLVLRDAFENWRLRKKQGQVKNGETFVIVTDGQPNDQRAVSEEIRKVTKHMDHADELKVKFFQVGKDSEASKFLRYLDDDLKSAGAKFDIVDTKTFDELENMSLKEALLAE